MRCAPIRTAPARKKVGEGQATRRSCGGLSTKIHTLADALCKPVRFFLTGGEAGDLLGADGLLPSMSAGTPIGDKAFDAGKRVIEPLAAAGKTFVVPPKGNRLVSSDYNRKLYEPHHRIEKFSANLKQFGAIATRNDKTARNFLGTIHLAAAVTWLS
jgi:transposase